VLEEEDRLEAERVFAKSDPSSALVVLPERRLDDGSGVYEKGLIDLVKDLRADGVTVSWGDEPEERAFVEKRSAAEVIWGAVLGVPSGVMSSAIWATVAGWFGKSPQSGGEVRVAIVREVIASDGTVTREWLTYQGTGADVAAAIEADAPIELPPGPSDE
jgi:hypothetical protein